MLLKNEAYLVRKSLKGNQRAQRMLFDAHIHQVYNSIFRIVGSQDEAQDLSQETFITAFEKLDQLNNNNFGAWIRRIAINKSLNSMRNKKNLLALDEQILQMSETTDVVIEEPVETEKIMEAIEALPNGARLVFTLYVLEELKHHEIAEELGISISTSKSQLSRARSILKKTLEQEYAY